ncbi:alpha/beta fold hydrolase [Streptomyces sp. NPDC013953]|uniref:alpha/beta fold hydrolase n=1 Tax=Streptomyces sp. NPDC013953 TaxID=3364868 RepID=UPI0036F8752E
MTGTETHVDGPWRYERVENAGHWLPLEAPERVNGLLLDFLAECRASAQAGGRYRTGRGPGEGRLPVGTRGA